MKKIPFLLQLVSEYVLHSRDQIELQTVACRLLLDIMPGLDTTTVFKENVSTSWTCFVNDNFPPDWEV